MRYPRSIIGYKMPKVSPATNKQTNSNEEDRAHSASPGAALNLTKMYPIKSITEL